MTHPRGNVCARVGTANVRARENAAPTRAGMCVRARVLGMRARAFPRGKVAFGMRGRVMRPRIPYKLIRHRWRLTVRARWAGSDAAGASRIGMRGGRRASRCENRGLITLAASPSGWRARLNDDSSACGKTDTGGTTGRGCNERKKQKNIFLYCSGRRYKRVCTAVEDGTKS